MLAKRIIPCLDVKDGNVVKGVQFKNHKIVGDIIELAQKYCEQGADELVFYDITASCDDRSVSREWVKKIAKQINIPFCVAGGIKSLTDAEEILCSGADKISINSPALQNPELINQLSDRYGKQCIVIGIDSLKINNDYYVYQYTGDPEKSKNTTLLTREWIKEVEKRGAGEIVLNCMNQDGMRAGYDITQLNMMRSMTRLPLIASGGAGKSEDFFNVFTDSHVDGALAASIFHSGALLINDLKNYLFTKNISIRMA
ncbi:imidazole glycerol phosphate synthase cyclase subunit [Gammaproteobacteria bacterium SCGC AG-212-F23]|nr:imidazole glycerol phosphate synthase cyclase subunit [Gammaproteobacteria bacterium SCGC AG-212-F23]